MDRTGRRQTPADPQEPAPDRKLQCLCSWLERTNQRETHAVQARALLPISAMTIGATLAAALVSADADWFATITITLAFIAAFVGFLIHRRRCDIWQQVARRLQQEQRILVDHERELEWMRVGRAAPDSLADHFGRGVPIRLFGFDALSLYGAALIISVLFALFALSRDDGAVMADSSTHPPKPAATMAPVVEDPGKRPTF